MQRSGPACTLAPSTDSAELVGTGGRPPARLCPGRSFPLGATVEAQGVYFSVYSRSATGIDLLLYDKDDDTAPSEVIQLNAEQGNRTFHYWHAFVPGIGAGQCYAYRARGPFDPGNGLRFDSDKVLLDPYGRAVAVPKAFDREAGAGPGRNDAKSMKSVTTPSAGYDWEGDQPLHHPFSDTVIYEMHVGGFTRHPNSTLPADLRGTFRGVIEKIPYLQELGISAVELLPVYQFDPQEAAPGLRNYWGYNPVSFFAPHHGYSSSNDPLGALNEFRDMVKALHRSGIEVILDVVYNHTAEGNQFGPTTCFKGLDNPTYYLLENGGGMYANYSGTGNTLNAGHAVVRRLIIDSLRYWVEEMHVDGFRFDLASILSRDVNGDPLPAPPILWDIETDPVLSGTKLLAEAWDAAGLYQVGSFFGDHWKEWNGRFRDDVRRFVKGDPDLVPAIADRFLASPDIYRHRGQAPERSVNFVTCHDGFTLNDLVSYDRKHNQANGEDGRDGHGDNASWNCGIEGPTSDEAVEALRRRQIRNLMTFNILAMGVPMMLMGDEVRRSQGGNNNAYCQDNEVSWFDWSGTETHRDILAFTRRLVRLRRNRYRGALSPELSLEEVLADARIRWHGVRLDSPDWSRESRSLALSAEGRNHHYYFAFNFYWKPLVFELPSPGPHHDAWRRLIDTHIDGPGAVSCHESAPEHREPRYTVADRSVLVLGSPRA